MKIAISTEDFSLPARARLIASLSEPVALNRAAAEGALPVYQRQLLANAQSNRNRFGARSTFWQRMNAGTRAGATALGGFVAMPREMRLRVKGGTITPRNGSKFLTLPMRAGSYGKSIRQFSDVFFVRRGGRLFACVKAGGKRIEIIYLLVRSVTIRGDTSLLPPDEVVSAAAVTAVRGFIRRNG